MRAAFFFFARLATPVAMASTSVSRAGEQCARWRVARAIVRPVPLRGRGGSPDSAARPRDARAARVGERRYLDEKRFSLRRAHLCDVRVCRFEGRDHVVRLASAAREGRVCCRRSPTAASAARARRRPGPCGGRSSGEPHGKASCPSTTTRTGPPRSSARAAGAGDLERVEELLETGEATAEDANGAGESAVSRAVRFAIETARGRDRLQMARALKCVGY